jgi:pimeloyl-ACP methyl ester carboxylesterase
VDVPDTHYARSGKVSIAYQVLGEGAPDLVFVPGLISNVEYAWQQPAVAGWLRRLASFARVVWFDKRGTGVSDRVTDTPTLETRMDDVRAVMDAVGSEQAVLMGVSEGGPMSILFAATYPDRASALILWGSDVKGVRADDYPWAQSFDEALAAVEEAAESWGTQSYCDTVLRAAALPFGRQGLQALVDQLHAARGKSVGGGCASADEHGDGHQGCPTHDPRPGADPPSDR